MPQNDITQTGVIRGYVLSPDNKSPIAKAQVTLFSADSPLYIGNRFSVIPHPSTTTNQQGFFQFDTLTVGDYSLYVYYPKYVYGHTDSIKVTYKQLFSVVTIYTKFNGYIRGVVHQNNLKMCFADAILRWDGNTPRFMVEYQVKADQDAIFENQDVFPGDYEIFYIKETTVNDFYTQVTVRVYKQEIAPNDKSLIWMEEPKGIQITGIIVDRKKRPIPGAAIRLIPTTPDLPFKEFTADITDSEGTYHLYGVPKGTFLIQVSRPGKTNRSRVNYRESKPIEIIWDKPVLVHNLRLTRFILKNN
ncbi:MAG: collagen binding domain-containing protein [bacterium]